MKHSVQVLWLLQFFPQCLWGAFLGLMSLSFAPWWGAVLIGVATAVFLGVLSHFFQKALDSITTDVDDPKSRKRSARTERKRQRNDGGPPTDKT